jgi:hypothetical protein
MNRLGIEKNGNRSWFKAVNDEPDGFFYEPWPTRIKTTPFSICRPLEPEAPCLNAMIDK